MISKIIDDNVISLMPEDSDDLITLDWVENYVRKKTQEN